MAQSNQKKQKFQVVDESNRFLYALCPVHKDTKPSLCINRVPNRGKPKGYFYCFGCGYFGEITSAEVDALVVNPITNAKSTQISRNFAELYYEYFVQEFALSKGALLAEKWGVSLSVIWELGVGWDGHAHTIPFYNLDKIVGIQRQFTKGFKCMVSGSNLGLIVPVTMSTDEVLFIPEGASDLACLLDMNFHGIGRPNALVGKDLVYNWLKRYNPAYKKIIVVADNNDAGIQGAKEVQDYIDSEHLRSMILLPAKGFKDVREWAQVSGKDYVKQIIKDFIK